MAKSGTKQGEPAAFIWKVVRAPKTDACVIWPFGMAAGGYGRVKWEPRVFNAHRVVCVLAHGEPENPKDDAAHACGNRACVNPAHLSWKSRRGNMADKLIHGTDNRGEKNARCKLTSGQVLEIRARRAAGTKFRTLMADYGTGYSTIQGIVRRLTWNWLD